MDMNVHTFENRGPFLQSMVSAVPSCRWSAPSPQGDKVFFPGHCSMGELVTSTIYSIGWWCLSPWPAMEPLLCRQKSCATHALFMLAVLLPLWSARWRRAECRSFSLQLLCVFCAPTQTDFKRKAQPSNTTKWPKITNTLDSQGSPSVMTWAIS